MNDEVLRKIVTEALQRIRAEGERHTPHLAQQILAWIQSLCPDRPVENYWTDPEAFPLLLTPWWLEHTLGQDPDSLFQLDLVYSSINMYYYIRLIDNLMDGDVPTDLHLLPVLGFFHTEFQRPYHRYFNHDHPFWPYFTTLWFHSAEVTILDAQLSEFDAAQFMNIAAQKTCAAKIPLAAVCYQYDRTDILPAWSQFSDRFGCWSQMLNDTFDWLKDSQSQTGTFFLSEAKRRKHPTESITEWVIREGGEWGMDTLATWMAELRALAQDLASPGLIAYLDTRAAILAERRNALFNGLQNLAKLRLALNRNL
ncbi:MAG: hypothetical protein HY268_08935 [Deltaproteobacteria bacterium]|nr:hypothetical protein [Deltaproteobacteria bacterium]